MNHSEKIAIIGKGAEFPQGAFGDRFSSKGTGNEISLPISRKCKRYMSVCTPRAIRVSEYAFSNAGVDPLDKSLNIGIYAGQYGYLHPHLTEFIPTFIETQPDTAEGAFKGAWESAKVSPFMVTQMLNNNLVGLLSLHWEVAGDCAALVRDSLSSVSTMHEAVFSLQQGACEVALAICAGADADLLAQNFLRNDGKAMPVTEPNHGATAFVLKRLLQANHDNNNVIGVIEHIFSEYDLETLMTKIEVEKVRYPDLKQVVYEFSLLEDADKFSQLVSEESQELTNLATIDGERGCPGLMSALHSALNDIHPETASMLVISGSENQHYAAVIIQRDI